MANHLPHLWPQVTSPPPTPTGTAAVWDESGMLSLQYAGQSPTQASALFTGSLPLISPMIADRKTLLTPMKSEHWSDTNCWQAAKILIVHLATVPQALANESSPSPVIFFPLYCPFLQCVLIGCFALLFSSQLPLKLKLIPLTVFPQLLLCQKVKQTSLSASCRDLISTKGLEHGNMIGRKNNNVTESCFHT